MNLMQIVARASGDPSGGPVGDHVVPDPVIGLVDDGAPDGRLRPASNKGPEEIAADAPGGTAWTVQDGGAALLDELHTVLMRYVVFPTPEAIDAVTLFIAATHTLPAFQHATRLTITSPEKRCGKSRLLDVINGTCHRPIMTVNATVAAIMRSIGDEHPPTLLIDEADTIFGSKKMAEQNEELRGLLNAGHQRGRPTLRCVGPNQTPTEFPSFAMAVLAGIGGLPDTITDRAVNITMRRRLANEYVAPFRTRKDGPILADLRQRLAAWASSALDDLAEAEPVMPVEDRAADTWEPLVAIADHLGGNWPQRARTACLKLTAEADEADEESSLNSRLLADVRMIFSSRDMTFMSSQDLVQALRQLDESPWGDFDLNPRKLAFRLKHFQVKPSHNAAKTARGYRLEDLTDAFTRYLRPDPSDMHGEQQKCPDGSSSTDGATRPESEWDICGACWQPIDPQLGTDLHPHCVAQSSRADAGEQRR
jgi:hypothetical protein